MKKKGSILARLGLALLVLAVVLVLGVVGYLKVWLPGPEAAKSFPKLDGELKVAGLLAPVEVIRDKLGVPSIYAANLHDVFLAQGYVHAQDRFWQMDAWRHIGSGTLSEMFGKAQVKTDAFLRTLGWRQTAQAEYDSMGPAGREIAESYAAGVNAYLAGRKGSELSLEYAVLGFLSPTYKVEPWTPVNSFTWGKAMAWDLGGNMEDEIERAILLKTLSEAQVGELYPDYPADYPVIVPKIGNAAVPQSAKRLSSATGPAAVSAAGSARAIAGLDVASLEEISANLKRLEAAIGPKGPDIGSNCWVVSGSLTATGKPILANDMHLGIQMPSIWYENALHVSGGPDTLDVTGFSFPGVPGVITGHNDRIAWGFTNLGPDVQDLFIERVNPANPDQYEVEGKWVDFEKRKETIKVAGGTSVITTVRISRHGPIVSDNYGSLMDRVVGKEAPASALRDRIGVSLPAQYVMALSWTALTPSSPFEAVWNFDKARNWDEFRQAARGWTVPAQNLVYADVDGNIGYQTPGHIPIRKKGDGTLPVPGWSGDYDWTGFIPFESLPWVFNPESGYIATANNQANSRDYPYLLTKDWDYGQRAARIVDMITKAPGKIDAAYIQGMHGDAKSLNAEVLVPLLMGLKLESALASVRDRYLKDWDYQEKIDSRPAVLFETFWVHLLSDAFDDQLATGRRSEGGSRWYTVVRNLVQTPDSLWWDDTTTKDRVEKRDDILARAFGEAVASLSRDYGKGLAKLPGWGSLHTATFANQTLGKSGVGLIEDLFNRGPYPTGGGKSLVNATGWVVGKGFAVDWLPSEREIIDLSNLDASLVIHTTGQSGHAFNKHYDDMIPYWTKVEYYHQWWKKESVEKDAEGRLLLKP
jgi:penicillin amidase